MRGLHSIGAILPKSRRSAAVIVRGPRAARRSLCTACLRSLATNNRQEDSPRACAVLMRGRFGRASSSSMKRVDERELRDELVKLRAEHRELDDEIILLEGSSTGD